MGFDLLHQAESFDDQPVEMMQLLLGELIEMLEEQGGGFGVGLGHEANNAGQLKKCRVIFFLV